MRTTALLPSGGPAGAAPTEAAQLGRSPRPAEAGEQPGLWARRPFPPYDTPPGRRGRAGAKPGGHHPPTPSRCGSWRAAFTAPPPHLGDGARAHVAPLAPQAPRYRTGRPATVGAAGGGTLRTGRLAPVKLSGLRGSLRRSPPSPARWDSPLPLHTSYAQSGDRWALPPPPTPRPENGTAQPAPGRAERRGWGEGGEGAVATFRLAAQPWQPVPFGGASLPRYAAPSRSLHGGGARHGFPICALAHTRTHPAPPHSERLSGSDPLPERPARAALPRSAPPLAEGSPWREV